MKIEHVAIWSNNIEKLKEFYCKYFNGRANLKYENKEKMFQSYFITFDSGARLEIMESVGIVNKNRGEEQKLSGITHIAVSVGTKEFVDELTEKIREDGYEVRTEPRKTGDGYYESSIFDPDGNIIEITI